MLSTSRAFGATTQISETLSTRWDSLESHITYGQCAAAPRESQLYLCGPAQLGTLPRSSFETSGLLVATNTALQVADKLRHKDINGQQLDELFAKYNDTNALVAARISYVAPGWMVGVQPFRASGRFLARNPSLPFASLTFREDIIGFAGMGRTWDFGSALQLEVGAQFNYIFRKETVAEATIIDFIGRAPTELILTQRRHGYFVDASATARLYDEFVLALQGLDWGVFRGGRDFTEGTLYLTPDRLPRLGVSSSYQPRIWVGRLQVGAELWLMLDRTNTYQDQWFATASYYVGPLRLMSSFRPGLLRTGLSLRFANYEASVGQEWYNTLAAERTQPRLLMGFSAGL